MGGHIEADQSFTGAWDAGDKDDQLLLFAGGLVDEFLDSSGRDAEVAGTGIMSSDGIDRVSGVEALRRFDDGRCRLVRGALPRIDVYDRGAIFAESKIEDLPQRSGVGSNRRMNSIGVGLR